MKKLIKMQFEQARMLMDLQKQFMQCQEIEKAHQLESMDQSMSRNFQDGTITSSKEDGSQIDPEEYKNIQHQGLIAAETELQSAVSKRQAQGELDSLCEQEGAVPDKIHSHGRADQGQRDSSGAGEPKTSDASGSRAHHAQNHHHSLSQAHPAGLVRGPTPHTASGKSMPTQSQAY